MQHRFRTDSPRTWRLAAFFVVALAGSLQAQAAGGHHAVDDAAILEPGNCKLEGWFERSGAPARLLHAAAGCRVGPVELSGGSDYEREAGNSQTEHGLTVKWAREVGAGWSIGAYAAPAWQARARPRYQGTTAAGLVTWAVRDGVQVHANLGRDFVHRGGDESRGGVSADWEFREGWTVMAERFRQEGGHFARAGLRWTPAKDWTVDLSRAVRLRGAGESSWTLGLTREFER